ncbi:MAG TPA: squalene/phytoene synthase family protein [Dongiaceae bacterium]|jgi:phytoene/squalene synthetase|nr:squalene/phytoene synthase family protein [Dongiaceae bacterium]
MLDSDIDYCLQQIRRLDRDRYLTVLAAPAAAAADLAVLYAFNLELALIRDSVSEPMLGQIRFQWWREAIDGIYAGTPRRHAVVTALAELMARRPLDRAHFERMIDARERELIDPPPADLAGLESHADDTSASLLALAAEAAGLAADDVRDLTRPVGVAVALIGTARATLYLAQRQRRMLPDDIVAATGLSTDALFTLKPQPALNAAIGRLAAAARAHLAAARRRRVPAALAPALRIGTLAKLQLGRLERSGYDLFDPTSIEGSPLDLWRLTAKRVLGTW